MKRNCIWKGKEKEKEKEAESQKWAFAWIDEPCADC